MDRFGIAFGGFHQTEIDVKKMVQLYKFAEDHRVESGWCPEIWRDTFVPLTALALGTRKMKLGSSIASIYCRGPCITAMTVASIDELSLGRMMLGLGPTVPSWVESQGIEFRKPVTRMREFVTVLRKVLKGETVSFDGEIFKISEFKMDIKPIRKTIPIYLAAIMPNMTTLAGEIADGIIVAAVSTAASVKKQLDLVRSGAKKSGRNFADIDVACLLHTAVSKDPKVALKAMKKSIPMYAQYQTKALKPLFEESGLPGERAKILEATGRGDYDSAAGAVSDKLASSLTLAGTPDECKRKLDEYRAAGVNLPILYFPVKPTEGMYSVEKTIDTLVG